jgi:hypothetical protein
VEPQKNISPPAGESAQGGGGGGGGIGFPNIARRKTLFNTAKGHGRMFKSTLKTKGASNPLNQGSLVASSPPAIGAGLSAADDRHTAKGSKTRRSSDPFNEFMKKLKKPAAQDIVQHLKNFRKQIVVMSTSATVDELSDSVQEFYRSTTERLTTHPLFNNMTESEHDETMDGVEKHLMTLIYNYVNSPASCDDEINDLLFVRRVNSLHWLEASILEVSLDMNNQQVQNIFQESRQELWNMEAKKAPQDKLNCVVKGCKLLQEAIRVSQNSPASADEFLPALIYLIIHTNPQYIHSNINYITRFTIPMRIMSGECGYYFTNLCGAVHFIENISAQNLKLSQEEFNSKMGYVDGKTDSDLLIEEYNDDEDYQQITILESCCQAIKDSNDRVNEMIFEIETMTMSLDELKEGIKDQVHSILRSSPPKSANKLHKLQFTNLIEPINAADDSYHIDREKSPSPLITFDD